MESRDEVTDLVVGLAGDACGIDGRDLARRPADSTEPEADRLGPQPPGLILIHMYGSDRSAWALFASQAQREGYSVIAIDMRGHGDTAALNPKSPKYRGFSTEDWRGVLLDIDAAKNAGLTGAVHVLTGHGVAHREAALALADAQFCVIPADGLDDASKALQATMPSLNTL